MKSGKASLQHYHDKRIPGQTPEPFASTRATGGSVFVIHQHAARHNHFDLRLEVNGSLWSWAVPKGPSVDPADKRLAVHVEPHPVDYAWFEGLIPEGNYGAGAMIIWDRGQWVPLADPEEGLDKGKLLFDLRGFKLHGRWTLVRTGRSKDSREWLLIKEQDAWVGRIPEPCPESVLSGLTVTELKSGAQPAVEARTRLRRSRLGCREPKASPPKPMLCRPGKPFTQAGWVFEIKYDGYRVMAIRRDGTVQLLSRSGRDIAANFPEIAEAVAALPYDDFILDGELVVEGPDGLPSFSRLQQRAQISRPVGVQRAAIALPARCYAFDVLCLEGYDLMPRPLLKRKQWLRHVLPGQGPIRYVDHIEKQGSAAFEQATAMGLEGLVAKRAGSSYQPGQRSDDWLKIPALKTDDFAVMGLVADGKDDFSSLLLAALDGAHWVYVGRAGSGLNRAERRTLRHALDRHESRQPAATVAETPRGVQWVQPRRAVEVRYKEFTRAGQLRQPVLLRHRDDKPAADCLLPPRPGDLQQPVAVDPPQPRQRVILSNQEKEFWPAVKGRPALTKGDMLKHYRAIARWMLPYLEDRPIVMTRYPDGIEGGSFFQHEAPKFLPDWIRRVPLERSKGTTTDYIVIDSEDALLYIANLGTIPIHVWSSRVQSIDRPDYCVLDLDPKGAPFADVMAVARELHGILDDAEAPHFLKTSGGSGLHILIPLGGQLDHEQSKSLGELIARICIRRLPDKSTIQRAVELREGRVYLDYLQNGRGKTIAAPFCARPNPAASVSMPLKWSELRAGLEPSRFHIGNAARRMRSLKQDPMTGLLTSDMDVTAVVAALGNLE
ncbi:MAG: DNA ligase D [Xanthomonadales bacterium]|nr:DNA ligase D [Xanthomonadales bacterium]